MFRKIFSYFKFVFNFKKSFELMLNSVIEIKNKLKNETISTPSIDDIIEKDFADKMFRFLDKEVILLSHGKVAKEGIFKGFAHTKTSSYKMKHDSFEKEVGVKHYVIIFTGNTTEVIRLTASMSLKEKN